MKLPLLLPSVALEDRSSLPKAGGIYYCSSRGEILYIGKASSLRRRWHNSHYGDHHKLGELRTYPGVRIHYKLIEGERMRSHVEAKEIRKYCPRLNRRNEKEDFWIGLWEDLQFVLVVCLLSYFMWRLLIP